VEEKKKKNLRCAKIFFFVPVFSIFGGKEETKNENVKVEINKYFSHKWLKNFFFGGTFQRIFELFIP
jgi:hypothetical protein